MLLSHYINFHDGYLCVEVYDKHHEEVEISVSRTEYGVSIVELTPKKLDELITVLQFAKLKLEEGKENHDDQTD